MDKICANCRAGMVGERMVECRLHPPVVQLGADAFPLTEKHWWCLDWQAKEKEKAEGTPTKRKTVYPADFAPDERACQLAKGQGQNVHALLAAFKDHHMSKGSIFKDWQAAFRTWLRNDLVYKQKGKL